MDISCTCSVCGRPCEEEDDGFCDECYAEGKDASDDPDGDTWADGEGE